MDGIKPPEPLQNPRQWKKWQVAFDFYLKATEKMSKAETVKIALLINCLGEQWIDVYNTLNVDADKDNLSNVISKFDKYFRPQINEVYERYKFCTQKQREDEPVEQYITELKTLASTCNYGTDTDNQVRDTLVCGLWDPVAIEKLLREPKLTLQMAETFLRAKEISKKQVKDIKFATETFPKSNVLVTDAVQKQFKSSCQRCGTKHPPKKCPASGTTCERCSKLNHFASVCQSKATEAETWQLKKRFTNDQKDESRFKTQHYCKNARQVHGVQTENHSDESYETSPVRLDVESLKLNPGNFICLDALEVSNLQDANVQVVKPWYETVIVEGKPVKFKLDPGSDVTTMPKMIYSALELPTDKLRASNSTVLPYMSPALTLVSTVQVKLSVKNKSLKTKLYIVDGNNMTHAMPLLSRDPLNISESVKAVYLCVNAATPLQSILHNVKLVVCDVVQSVCCGCRRIRDRRTILLGYASAVPACIERIYVDVL